MWAKNCELEQGAGGRGGVGWFAGINKKLGETSRDFKIMLLFIFLNWCICDTGSISPLLIS